MPSRDFERLLRFITDEMRMSHVYQPVMLETLLKQDGTATIREIALALLGKDEAQISYYEEIVKRMPGPVLRRRGIVESSKGSFTLIGSEGLDTTERSSLIALCREKVEAFLAKRRDPWAHRRTSAGYIPGTLKYEVLKRAARRCELCGVSADVRALEADHIVPRTHGGSDEISNLQALCYSCNATKRDRDDTDFRGIANSYNHREVGCLFCEIEPARIEACTELIFAIRDAHPVTDGHTLLVPRRHVASPLELHQPELNAMWGLAKSIRHQLRESDPSIDGFNLGFNDGESAGQTILHARVHLIPRRTGDMSRPRGGVRGVIPDRQSY